jgi:nucleotide-binding universal stress UspA family protein
MTTIKKILVPVDFSECSVAAVEHALALSDAFGATVEVVHTYDVPSFVTPNVVVFAGDFEAPLAAHADRQARDQLANFLKRVGAKDLPQVNARVLIGPAGPTILDIAESEHPDLLVIGTHGRTGVARMLMGSTAEKVLRNARCPVLAVKANTEPVASLASEAP